MMVSISASAVTRFTDFENPPTTNVSQPSVYEDYTQFNGEVRFSRGFRRLPIPTWTSTTTYYNWNGQDHVEVYFSVPVKNISFKMFGFYNDSRGRAATIQYSSQSFSPAPENTLSPSPVLYFAPSSGPTFVTVNASNIRYMTIDYSGQPFAIDDFSYLSPAAGDSGGTPTPPRSPVVPGMPDETRFVVTSPTTTCRFASSGPLDVSLSVDRYVGKADISGQLFDAGTLVSNHLLSATAMVTIAAWDVDPAETDYVTFNGHLLGKLAGSDNQWSISRFSIPIQDVNFASNTNGSLDTGFNTVEITIDPSGGGKQWCTSIDWAQLEFNAIAPILLVHGIAAHNETWGSGSPSSPGVQEYLDGIGVPYEAVDVDPRGSLENNGVEVSAGVERLAQDFGTRRCHIVAHSKGGNDSRAFLGKYYNPTDVKVLSLYTLSTPIQGSILSDITSQASLAGAMASTDPSIDTLVAINSLVTLDWWITLPMLPCCEALESLRPISMKYFNAATPFPSTVKFYNFGADADSDGDHSTPPTPQDCAPVVPDTSTLWSISLPKIESQLCSALYETLANVATVSVGTVEAADPSTGASIAVPSIDVATTTKSFQENDLAVTVTNAQHPSAVFLGQLVANHSTIKSATTMQGILSRIAADYPVVEPK